ncbi:saccharopine dehydrogenase [Paracoccus aeridis]|uniref:saccharopine dehydrogenase n=1 Tax=Paracoccus aeridis TaxID=1966466 RepID=UPI0010AA7995|nr:saccharopine dehydrogenase [Paracoccus aeridis]
MTHLWVRAESRLNEDRVGITPDGVADLIREGFAVTVEESRRRVLPIRDYADAGARIAPEGSWTTAPGDAIVFGLKELPADGTPLPHRHVMFGHAFKGQRGAETLLGRFRAGGGRLYDIEYLVDEGGRRLAAFGYWAGFAGAAVSLKCWAAQQRGGICGPVLPYPDRHALTDALRAELDATGRNRPTAIVIGAHGRVGTGASDLLAEMGLHLTRWGSEDTRSGGPFPEVMMHDLFLNCIFARPGSPVFVPPEAVQRPRELTVIGDVACDPDGPYNPVPVYDHITSWASPAARVADNPPLDVMAIDNLPSLLPRESSLDFAQQLLPVLRQLDRIDEGPWARAGAVFDARSKEAAA